jgi:hypothetical protein
MYRHYEMCHNWRWKLRETGEGTVKTLLVILQNRLKKSLKTQEDWVHSKDFQMTVMRYSDLTTWKRGADRQYKEVQDTKGVWAAESS